MPFQCFQMGLLRVVTQLVQLLQDQRDQVHKQAQHLEEQTKHLEEQTKLLKELLQKQDQHAYDFTCLHNQIGAIELRTSKTMSSPGDALRHVGQEGCGEIWGANPQCYQQLAQLLRQQQVFSKGHLPVLADICRGQFYAAQDVLQQANLLAEDEAWRTGHVACAMPEIQKKIVTASQKVDAQNPLTAQEIDQIMGITHQVRAQLNQAIENALPRHHLGDQDPVQPGNPEYTNTLYEMLPRHIVTAMFQGTFQRP